jgi:hypothetical protein
MQNEYYIEQFRDKTKPEGVVHQTYPPAPIQYLEGAKKLTEKSQNLYTVAVFKIKMKND